MQSIRYNGSNISADVFEDPLENRLEQRMSLLFLVKFDHWFGLFDIVE